MNKKIKLLSLIFTSGIIAISSGIFIPHASSTFAEAVGSTPKERVLRINMDTPGVPGYGKNNSGKFSVKTTDGNSITFAYKDFGVGTYMSQRGFMVGKNGYVMNLTPINNIKTIYCDQPNPLINKATLRYGNQPNKAGGWVDGYEVVSPTFPASVVIGGNQTEWNVPSNRQVNSFKFDSPNLAYICFAYLGCTYTC